MRYSVNGKGSETVAFHFDNGWAISISRQPCNHVTIAVSPANVINDDAALAEWLKTTDYDTLVASGDIVEHFDGSDADLAMMIVGVASRPTEPTLARASDMINSVLKR